MNHINIVCTGRYAQVVQVGIIDHRAAYAMPSD